MQNIKLPNGKEMPIIGFGTYMTDLSKVHDATLHALKSGYKLLDTAKWYNNEEIIGAVIAESKIPREELFITGKVEAHGYINTIDGIYDTLNKLRIQKLDLVLIHWPTEKSLETYQALEDLVDAGLIESIGLSNFNEKECDEILKNCRIKPVLNQIETHIYFQEKRMREYLKKNNIAHEGWSPFAEGYMKITEDEKLKELSKKYNKTPAQIALRFFVQNNIIVIPKSINPSHIEENIDIFDFELEEKDMKEIEKLDQKKQYSDWPKNMKIETEY